ncbi:hypothetical protein [Niveispirillum sp. KHB5.9]|uniref:hypothetical protein n=1 Tax=Niveispirillum sp. KHB5.9 TaxID=3400269 RepID=UPI003A8723D6
MGNHTQFTRHNGTSGNDTLEGGAGFDLLNGGTGNDTLNGGGGLNAAVYSGNADAYGISGIDSPTVVISGFEGTDTLTNVQFAIFADKVVPLYKPTPLFEFDEQFYLNSNPDVFAAVQNGTYSSGLQHYNLHGQAEGRLGGPSGVFDAGYYVAVYGDVDAANIPAIDHYNTYGRAEDRSINLLFDVDYYLSSNPDVAAAGVDPWTHYTFYGWKEGRNPSPFFDSDAYLAANPDVVELDMSPLYHYLNWGQKEGRDIYLDTFFLVA